MLIDDMIFFIILLTHNLHEAESNMSPLLILLLYELIIQEYSFLSWFSGIGIFKTR